MTAGTQYFGGRARRVALPSVHDSRGVLLPMDFSGLPFTPCRAFVVRDVPVGAERGQHAHRRGRQLLLCLSGRLVVDLRCEGQGAQCVLEPGGHALLVEPGVWAQQTYAEEGTAMLAFASEPYDPAVYIQDPC